MNTLPPEIIEEILASVREQLEGGTPPEQIVISVETDEAPVEETLLDKLAPLDEYETEEMNEEAEFDSEEDAEMDVKEMLKKKLMKLPQE